ncbi:MAG: 1-deoxy-D-xylulose-5-phosphate reductoisomerase [Desulfonatronovibrionaceae bacterium]
MISYISSLTTDKLSQGKRSVSILGCTGSIGTSALKVIRANPEKFIVKGLAGARNLDLLAEQAHEFRPDMLAVLDRERASELKNRLRSDYQPRIVWGTSGYTEMAEQEDVPVILSAMVGAAGLVPTMAAARQGKVILLANKESLVLAGSLMRSACAESGSVVLPVDSEHNAVFQALQGHNFSDVQSIIITASGGPFRSRTLEFMEQVSPEQALSHPNWSMGAKISIDSATMMNKGLEVIEAHHLFGLDRDKIRILVHPQSIVHSLVCYSDGSLLAHLGVPDMMIPISHCLGFPERLNLDLEPLDLAAVENLSFSSPDLQAFPCLALALQALSSGPDYPVVLNAANEVCVDKFLQGSAGFMDIPRLVSRAMDHHVPCPITCIEDILELDQKTRQTVNQWTG